MDIYFEVFSCLGRRIRITHSHWLELTEKKHPDLAERAKEIQETVIDADFVRISREDEDVFLYYKQFGKYHVCVVSRHLNGDGFIITSYLTDRPKEGKEIWRR
jgi:hypothetical protein